MDTMGLRNGLGVGVALVDEGGGHVGLRVGVLLLGLGLGEL